MPATCDAHTNPDGLISFVTAENALMKKELEEFAETIRETHYVLTTQKVPIPSAAFSYAYCTADGPRLPAAFAAHMNKYFNLHTLISPSNVKVAAAATAPHDILAYSLCVLGEGILTTKPYYGRFEIDSGNKAGVRLVAANTDHKTCFDEGVLGVLAANLRESEEEGIKIRAVFDC